MKSAHAAYPARSIKSLPVRGAWIEIKHACPAVWAIRSLPVRGAWIEICIVTGRAWAWWSLPVRGAWIEIKHPMAKVVYRVVAPRKGSVD